MKHTKGILQERQVTGQHNNETEISDEAWIMVKHRNKFRKKMLVFTALVAIFSFFLNYAMVASAPARIPASGSDLYRIFEPPGEFARMARPDIYPRLSLYESYFSQPALPKKPVFARAAAPA